MPNIIKVSAVQAPPAFLDIDCSVKIASRSSSRLRMVAPNLLRFPKTLCLDILGGYGMAHRTSLASAASRRSTSRTPCRTTIHVARSLPSAALRCRITPVLALTERNGSSLYISLNGSLGSLEKRYSGAASSRRSSGNVFEGLRDSS